MISQSHSQIQSHRPLTTAHLAQTMSLMSLTAVELRQRIDSELASNPALELIEERRCPTCHLLLSDAGPCPICCRPQNLSSDQPIVFVSPRDDFYSHKSSPSTEDTPNEDLTADAENLATYVLRQIAPDLMPEDRKLAVHILTCLDEDGLLRTSLAEIARYHHVRISRVEYVLRLIQRTEPVGVGSQSPQDALLVQLDVLAETRPIPEHAAKAVQLGMDLLTRLQYNELGRLLGIPSKKAKEIAQFISRNLNPFPARAHWGNIRHYTESSINPYIHPDVIITSLNDAPDSSLVVEVISPLAGQIRVNPLFRESLPHAPAEKTKQWQDDLEQASLLVKCVQQRNRTIVRLMQLIAVIQRKFILNGDAHLIPITRAKLATELEVHESTVSRAVSNKGVQLPNGHIVPLSKMFDRSLHIRSALREIIAQETKPLTDSQIASLLEQKGHPVARRTVAKYRAMEGILPAYIRKNIKQKNLLQNQHEKPAAQLHHAFTQPGKV